MRGGHSGSGRKAARAAAVLALLAAAGAAPAAQPVARPPLAPAGSVFLKLQQRGAVGGLAVTPLRVEEDSRCPIGVQCFQAGTVRLSVRIGSRARHVLTQGQPLRAGSRSWLTLCDVIPHPARDGRPKPADYRFGFVLLQAALPPLRGRACPTPTLAPGG